jgi:hypothetical protein
MTQVQPPLRDEISNRVQAALDRHQPRRYRVAVDHDAILEDDGWYHVVVVSENDERDRDFYDALAEAEAELQDQNGHQFLLVPAIAD